MSDHAAQDFAAYSRHTRLSQEDRDWCAEQARRLGIDAQPRRPNPVKPHSSQYRGVHYAWWYGVWRACCACKQVGQYATELEAAHAYDKASWERWHDLRRLNFTDEYMDRIGEM